MKKNVFIVGFAKSGTTLLAHELRKNGFSFSAYGKEPTFFDYRYKGLKNINKSSFLFKKYKNSFKGNKTIDASPWKISKTCAEKIKELYPEGYIIFCIRDKLKRAESHFLHLNRLTGITLQNLIKDMNNLDQIDSEKFNENLVLSNFYTEMPNNIFIRDYEEIINSYKSLFGENKVFIFDADNHKDEDKLSNALSIFLDDEIKISLNKQINSHSNQFNPKFTKFLRKIDYFMLINKMPIPLKEFIKKSIPFLRKKNLSISAEQLADINRILKNEY